MASWWLAMIQPPKYVWGLDAGTDSGTDRQRDRQTGEQTDMDKELADG